MDKLEIIKSIIHDKYMPISQNSLIEEDKDVKGKKFKVEYPIVKKSINIEYALYRFDNSDFPYFRDVSDLKKMCDYILFVQEKKQLIVFVIELKLSNDSAKKQLDAAKEFVDFIVRSGLRIGLEIKDYIVKKVRICESKVSRKNNFMRVEEKYNFDNNNYLDYQISKSFLIEPLLNNL